MGQVTAAAEKTISAPPEQVIELLADYRNTRPKLLTGHYSEYEVREGGRGAGTVVHWRLAATKKRVRDCLITVRTPRAGTLVEEDANSSMVTTWTVSAEGGITQVRVETTWRGAGGIGGFFERTFAPGGLKRIYDEQLARLEGELAGMPRGD